MAEKLLTKLSGFLISCAMPAVSWPSEASFSVCTRRSCAVRKSSSDFANSRVRASTLSNKPRVLDGDYGLRGEALQHFDVVGGEGPRLAPSDDDDADRAAVRRSIGTASMLRQFPAIAMSC